MTDRETTSVDEKPSILDLTAPHTRRDFLKKAGLGTAGLAAAWVVPQITSVGPASAQSVLTQVTENLCADGKPGCLILQYTGNDNGTSHSQELSWSVVGTIADIDESPVWIEVKGEPGGDTWLPPTKMALGEIFKVCGEKEGESDTWHLAPQTIVYIYADDDDSKGGLIQTVNFHTSCSQPLNAGDQFGSIKVVSLADPPDAD